MLHRFKRTVASESYLLRFLVSLFLPSPYPSSRLTASDNCLPCLLMIYIDRQPSYPIYLVFPKLRQQPELKSGAMLVAPGWEA